LETYQDAEKRILNGKSQMEDGKNPIALASAIFHSTSGRAFQRPATASGRGWTWTAG
jgi:hypothetical protein